MGGGDLQWKDRAQRLLNTAVQLALDPRPTLLRDRLEILRNSFRGGDEESQLWEHYDVPTQVTYWVWVLIPPNFGPVGLLQMMQRMMSTGDFLLEEERNGEFGVTMVDAETFRITVVDRREVKKFDPIKVIPEARNTYSIRIHSPRERVTAFDDWKATFDGLKSMLKTMLFIAIPKDIMDSDRIASRIAADAVAKAAEEAAERAAAKAAEEAAAAAKAAEEVAAKAIAKAAEEATANTAGKALDEAVAKAAEESAANTSAKTAEEAAANTSAKTAEEAAAKKAERAARKAAKKAAKRAAANSVK